MKSIKSYIQKQKPALLIQGRVETELAKKLRAKLKKENVTIREFMEAAIQAYLDEK